MSASNSPSNSGQPKGSLNSTPKPTNLARYGPRILLAGVALGIGYALIATRAPAVPGSPNPPNPLRTQGVKNIEGAYQKGGATATHTKAYGGTTLGQKEDITRGGDGEFGTGQPKGFKGDHFGDVQRNGPGPTGKVFNEMKYGDGKGK